MSRPPPPPPPHLTSNYKQLLLLGKKGERKVSEDVSKNPLKRSFNHQQSPYQAQQDFRLEPLKKGMRMTQNSSLASFPAEEDFTHDNPTVIAKSQEILELLKQFTRPLSTKEIVKNCGHFFKYPLQPILYRLHDQGLVLKQHGYGVQAWKFNPNPSSPSPKGKQPKSVQYPSILPSYQSSNSFQPQQNYSHNISNQPSNRHRPPAASTFSPLSSGTSIKHSAGTKKNFFISSDIYNALNKNPVSALNELAQKNKAELSYELLCENPGGHKNKFTVAAMVDGKMYDAVSASNMKEARRDAADAALKVILQECAVVQDQMPSAAAISLKTTHFDQIAAISHRAYLEKTNMVHEKLAGRKVVSCMVMKRDFEDQGIVVAMGTGNRCITGQRLSMEGKVVNDSHAEIVCRRSFLSFMYTEVENSFAGQSSIFQKGGYNGRSKLKDGVTFHLYISTAPCGDGALFTPRQDTDTAQEFPNEHTPTFCAKSHGILRTKIEDGEGTIPIDANDPEQSFDGILRGQRLRTMSCSDKICRWNVVGLQGALLSHLIEPVYVDSLTLGYLYDHGHLSRAICCRLDCKDGKKIDDTLPMPFALNHPWIGRVTEYEASRETEKTNNVSMNWCLHDVAPEVTDGRTGAQLTRTSGAPTPSRLCKLELLKRFQSLVRKSPDYSHLIEAPSYRDLKQKACEFQLAKQCMVDKFAALKFGRWVVNPKEQDMF